MLGEYAPANLLNVSMYYPRVTIIYPNLTEIIPLDTTYGSPKSRYKHIYT